MNPITHILGAGLDTALHAAVSTRKGRSQQEIHAIMTFLDVGEAFNNS